MGKTIKELELEIARLELYMDGLKKELKDKRREERDLQIKKQYNLMDRLREFADGHNECDIDWDNIDQEKYYIYATIHPDKPMELRVTQCSTFRDFGNVYFTSETIASMAIINFRDELFEYFKNN